MRTLGLALLLAACGDDVHIPDAALGPTSCTATFTGNFADTSATADNCAHLDDTTLSFTLSSAHLTVPLSLTIDLGPTPVPTTYSSETVHAWTARGYFRIPNSGGGLCEYSAGAGATPPGNFSLSLAYATPTPHGSLELVLWVLAFPGSACGDPDTEHLSLVF